MWKESGMDASFISGQFVRIERRESWMAVNWKEGRGTQLVEARKTKEEGRQTAIKPIVY